MRVLQVLVKHPRCSNVITAPQLRVAIMLRWGSYRWWEKGRNLGYEMESPPSPPPFVQVNTFCFHFPDVDIMWTQSLRMCRKGRLIVRVTNDLIPLRLLVRSMRVGMWQCDKCSYNPQCWTSAVHAQAQRYTHQLHYFVTDGIQLLTGGLFMAQRV